MFKRMKQLSVSAVMRFIEKISTLQWKNEFPATPGLYWLSYRTTDGWTRPILVEIKMEYDTFLISSGEKFWGVNGSQALFNCAVTCQYSERTWALRVLESRWRRFTLPPIPTE